MLLARHKLQTRQWKARAVLSRAAMRAAAQHLAVMLQSKSSLAMKQSPLMLCQHTRQGSLTLGRQASRHPPLSLSGVRRAASGQRRMLQKPSQSSKAAHVQGKLRLRPGKRKLRSWRLSKPSW